MSGITLLKKLMATLHYPLYFYGISLVKTLIRVLNLAIIVKSEV